MPTTIADNDEFSLPRMEGRASNPSHGAGWAFRPRNKSIASWCENQEKRTTPKMLSPLCFRQKGRLCFCCNRCTASSARHVSRSWRRAQVLVVQAWQSAPESRGACTGLRRAADPLDALLKRFRFSSQPAPLAR